MSSGSRRPRGTTQARGRRRSAASRSAVPRADPALRQQLREQHAFEALTLIRKRALSVAEAAREVGESAASVLRYIKPALRKDRRGRYVPRASDQLTRHLTVLTREAGKVEGPVHGSRQAAIAGSHWNAIGDYLEGRPSALRKFRGQKIRIGRKTYTLEADPRVVARRAAEGEVAFESIYGLTR